MYGVGVRQGALGRRDPGKPLKGAFIGATIGFIIYWSGAALISLGDLMQTPAAGLPSEFARPLHTVTTWEVLLVAVGGLFGAMIAKYRWHSTGVLGYVGLVSMIVGFLAYSITVSIPSVPPEERWLSYILLFGEVGGLGLVVVFSFYTLDAATRQSWRRHPDKAAWDPTYVPVVAFMVPVFNEDCEMVEGTIDHLINQDYPADRFLVVVCDDSTDPRVRKRLRAYCEKTGAYHLTRTERRGFKAGALNNAIRLLAPEVEYVAVIDADYWVRPDYARSVVGYFVDPALSFVQTPQDYRNLHESFLTRRYKRAESYFYHGIMPSRNEENAIIFCGTMGMLRRKAVEEIGGFAEDQICEDAEISVRLAANGWRSMYVDKSYGKGLMPAVFEAYKKQFYRWAFGNVRILLTRTKLILRSPMSRRQKVDYLVSNLHWFDGFFVTTIAFVLLYLGLGPILGYDAVTHHQKELELLALVPIVLLLDGIIRLHLVLNRAGHTSIGETLLVQGVWMAIKFTNMIAVFKCLMGVRTPFVRTPKHPGRRLSPGRALGRSLRLTKAESAIGLSLMGVAVFNLHHAQVAEHSAAVLLMPFWLALYGLFFLTAPIYAYLSYRTLGRKYVSPRKRNTRRRTRRSRSGPRRRRIPAGPDPLGNPMPLQMATPRRR